MMIYTTTANIRKVFDPNMDDPTLEKFLEQATNLLDAEIGENLGIKERTRRIDGSGTRRIIMENHIHSVEYIRAVRERYTYALDYIDGSIIYLRIPTSRGQKNLEIKYEMGYETVPEDLERYFIEFCRVLIERGIVTDDTSIVKSKSIGDISVTYFTPGELADSGSVLSSPGMRMILRKYKNFTVYPIV